MVHNIFAIVVTLTELTGRAVATFEANEATASVKFVASVKIRAVQTHFKKPRFLGFLGFLNKPKRPEK